MVRETHTTGMATATGITGRVDVRISRWIAWIPFLLVSAAHSAIANDSGWEFSPRLSVSQVYTDNLNLARPGEEESEHITTASAGFRVARERARNYTAFSYNLLGIHYWSNDGLSTVVHQGRAENSTVLMPNRLFLDTDVGYSQRLPTTRGAVPLDILTPARRSNQTTFRVSPYWQERFGRFAFGHMRYSFEGIRYSGEEFESFESDAHRFNTGLSSGAMFTTIGWNIDYNRSEIDYGDDSKVIFDILEGLLRWNITQRFSVFGAGGRERNDFEFNPVARPRPDDDFWRAGITWQPNNRTSMNLFYGERFFGETYGASLNHRSRHANWTLDYTESPRTISTVTFSPGLGLIEVDGELFLIEVEIPELDTDVFVSRRLSAGVSGSRYRTNLSLRVYQDRREYQNRPERDQHVTGVATSNSMRLTPRTRLLADARWQQNEFIEDARKDELFSAGVGLTRDMTRTLDATLRYRYQQRSSNLTGLRYEENRLTATITATY